jgi:hypothetical protein
MDGGSRTNGFGFFSVLTRPFAGNRIRDRTVRCVVGDTRR